MNNLDKLTDEQKEIRDKPWLILRQVYNIIGKHRPGIDNAEETLNKATKLLENLDEIK